MVLAIAFALFTPKYFTYSTSIEIGSQIINGTVQPFESPETLLAKIQHSFIPHVLNTHHNKNKTDKSKHKIDVSIPQNSVILILETKGTEDKSELAIDLLRETTNRAKIDHKRIYDAVKQNLITQRERAKSELSLLETTSESAERERILRKDIALYEIKLTNLRNTREILPPMKSTDAIGVSKKLLVIAAAFISTFLAISLAFFVEFISRVKDREVENN